MTLDEILAGIYAGPAGPTVGAFFDYDGTIISGYSASAFYAERLRRREMGAGELARTAFAAVRGVKTTDDFRQLLDLSLQGWQGRPAEELEQLGRSLFKRSIAAQLHTEMWEIVQAHHAMGHTVVLASSATHFQIAPMAEALGAHHVLCTHLRTDDGMITGELDGPPLWGFEKAEAVRMLATDADIDLTTSHAYSNGREDVPFLEAVAHPCAVSPDSGLRAEAGRQHWPVLDCRRRGGRPGLEDLARTAGFYGSFGLSTAIGIGVGVLNRSREQIWELAAGMGSDLGLALAGVDVAVLRGSDHLWSARPCVFVFNHQSNIDPIVVMKLLRGGFTGVAKKEARNIPGFGQLFQIAGVAFVDRGNIEQAKQALAPAVDKLRAGTSLAMSPEGTRSPTPLMGRFKKGAFHIAMQAGVPVVPIVLRGAGAVFPPSGQTLHQGRIEVVVLPPVDVSDWTVDKLDDHVNGVRELFVETLAAWPGRPNRELTVG